MRMPRNDSDFAGYVECSECGHPLERHTMAGCDWRADEDGNGCGCTVAWSVRRIGEERRAAGMSGSFKRWNF